MTVLPATERRTEQWWATYLKGAGFLAPPVFIWAVVAIFAVPKVKQILADSGSNAYGVFGTIDMIREHPFVVALSAIALIIAFEKFLPAAPRYRRSLVAAAVFIINTAVLLSITFVLMSGLDATFGLNAALRR